MGQKSVPVKAPAEQVVKEIRRAAQRLFLHCVPARRSWTRCRTETKALQRASPQRVIAGAEQPDAVSSRRPGSRVEHRAAIG